MMIMMMMMRRRLACCSGEREAELDFEEQERIMRYNGLETCILSSAQSYENESGTSRGDGCTADSTDEDDSSWSSSKDGFGSFSSRWMMKRDDEWEFSESPRHFYVKENPNYVTCYSDVETMKERFAKLLLGEDVSGGSKALSTALALSNAITNLAASVFGEMWKLEPLPQERKNRWRREMEWLLSPAKYMVELVPAKQKGANGNTVEIMIPKVRKDIDMNLPALQKLDSLLMEMLDSMVNTEFWYMEGGSRAEGRTSHARHGKKWWLPSAQVPTVGLSDSERAKLLYKSKVVHQVFKAAKSINQNVLQEMPVPTAVRDALPKSGKASLGEELYRILSAQSSSPEEMLKSLNLKSEHRALETMNRLEGAMFQWEQKVKEQTGGKSPMRTSWSFMKDPLSEVDRMELLFNRAEALLQQLKSTYQNLPQTFLEVTKIQYGKDIGHSILEAYSRVLGSLAFSMLSRIGDILQEDVLSNPNSPLAKSYVPGTIPTGALGTPVVCSRVRHSLIDQMNKVDGKIRHSDDTATSDTENSPEEAKMSSVTATPSRSRVWCIGREACGSNSPPNSP